MNDLFKSSRIQRETNQSRFQDESRNHTTFQKLLSSYEIKIKQ